MSPPTFPPNSPAIEIANIIVGALRERGFDAGISEHTIKWQDFDITIFWNNLSIGSKRRNRSWLQAYWDRKIITLQIYGQRHPISEDEHFIVNLADPQSLDDMVDFIIMISIQDKYSYPFIS